MDDATRREIDKVCWRTLKEAGITEPPSNTKLILEHLELYREFLRSPRSSSLRPGKTHNVGEWPEAHSRHQEQFG